MDFTAVRTRLAGTPELLVETEQRLGPWKKQNNDWDAHARFIYQYQERSLQELLNSADYTGLRNIQGLSEHDADKLQQYALHRWYNFVTSTEVEKILNEYGAQSATEENNYLNHVDNCIGGTWQDIKITKYPLTGRNFTQGLDLKKREAKNQLIKELYGNQSTGWRAGNNGGRNNRLFVVCDDPDRLTQEKLRMDFDQIEMKVSTYLKALPKLTELNKVTLESGDSVYADVIRLTTRGMDLKRKAESVCPRCHEGHLKLRMSYRNPEILGNFFVGCERKECSYLINV